MGSIEKAIEHTKFMLFRPFDLNKWIAMGVIIFLSVLGTGGAGGSFPNFQSPGGTGTGTSDPREIVDEARTFVTENFNEIVLIGGAIFLFIVAISVLIAWLGARGRLMFVRAVALDDAGIGVNWTEAGKLSSSLFWFSIVLMLLSWMVMLLITGVALLLIVRAVDAGANSFDELMLYFLVPVLLILLYTAVILPIWLLLNDFVVPVMYRFNVTVGLAWRIVLGMIGGNILTLTLFYVIRFVVAIVKGIVIMLAGCATCCVGFLPVVSQALTAPVHVFDRAFSMFALQSMSPDFEMITPITIEVDPFEGTGDSLSGY